MVDSCATLVCTVRLSEIEQDFSADFHSALQKLSYKTSFCLSALIGNIPAKCLTSMFYVCTCDCVKPLFKPCMHTCVHLSVCV